VSPPRKAGRHAERFDLDGGTVALLEESHAVPLVSIAIVFRSGATHDPVGKEGALRVAGRMLRRGCVGLNATAIEDAIDRLGAELTVDVSHSSVAVHAQVIGRNLEPFVDLMTKLVCSPTFPGDELERLRRESVAELVEIRNSDAALAHQAFRRSLFGDHLYGRSSRGTIGSLGALTAADVSAAYAKHFVRANAVLGFSGDIEAAHVKEIALRLVGGLPAGGPIGDNVPPTTMRSGRHLVLVDKPERTQTQILVGGLGTSPHDEDHVALGVANAVFGGSFTSRLMREVRSKRGWSYGASARLAVDRQRQAFSMVTFPAATDAAPCIALELELLEKYVASGVTPRELAFIKRFLTRSHAFDIDTAAKRLHQAVDVEILGLPIDYYEGYVDHVEAVTLQQANAAVQRRISVDDLLIVVVGTAGQILEGVTAAIPRLASHQVVPFDRD
jgi:zinc protease